MCFPKLTPSNLSSFSFCACDCNSSYGPYAWHHLLILHLFLSLFLLIDQVSFQFSLFYKHWEFLIIMLIDFKSQMFFMICSSSADHLPEVAEFLIAIQIIVHFHFIIRSLELRFYLGQKVFRY